MKNISENELPLSMHCFLFTDFGLSLGISYVSTVTLHQQTGTSAGA